MAKDKIKKWVGVFCLLALACVSFPKAVRAQAHPIGTNISLSDGTVYTLTTENGINVRRPYTSAGAFLSYGFNSWDSVVAASLEDISLPIGSFIPPQDGNIICSDRGSDKGTCYQIVKGKKAGFVSEEVFVALGFSFANSQMGDVSWMQTDVNIENSALTHREGTLVNIVGTVYLVGQEGLLGLPDVSTFNSYGYSFANVVPANAADVAMSEVGTIAPRQPGQLTAPKVLSPVPVPAPLPNPPSPLPTPPPVPLPPQPPTLPPPIPAPAPTPPPSSQVSLGRHFTDADFGSQIIQVTNSSDGAACYNAYSYWPSFNKNSTRFFITCDEKAISYTFDPTTFKITSKQDLFSVLPTGGLPDWQDAIWSGTDPNTLFAQRGLKLWAYNLTNRSYTLVKDFSSELPGKFLWQMSKSLDDNRFAFTLEDIDNNYARTAYMVWDKTRNEIIYQKNNTILDEAQIDKSGRYLAVKTGVETKGQVRIIVVDLQNNSEISLLDGPTAYPPGHSDNGWGTLLGSDNWNNSFTIRQLSDPQNYTTILSLGNDWSQASHISFLGDNEGWVLISLFTPGGLSSGKYHDEVILVSTDGSNVVKELAKTHSVYKDYWDSPRATISRDGKFAIFTSNWDGLRRDAYLLKID